MFLSYLAMVISYWNTPYRPRGQISHQMAVIWVISSPPSHGSIVFHGNFGVFSIFIIGFVLMSYKTMKKCFGDIAYLPPGRSFHQLTAIFVTSDPLSWRSHLVSSYIGVFSIFMTWFVLMSYHKVKKYPGRSLSSQRRKCSSIYRRVWVAPTCPSNVAGSPWPFAQIKGLIKFLLITTNVSILSGLLLDIVSFGCTSCGVLIARSVSKILHRTTTTQTPRKYRKKESARGLLIWTIVMALNLIATSQREIL